MPRRGLVIGVTLAGVALAGAVAWWLGAGRRAETPPPRHWPVAVVTFSGSGSPRLADGAFSAASFSDPFGVALDPSGRVYVSDAGDNNLIRTISPAGDVTTLAGGKEGFSDGAGTEAAFHTPSGVAVAPDGTLVVADTGNHAIRRVSAEGVVTTIAGGGGRGRVDGPAADARFDGPVGVAVAGDGTVFVADTYNDCIRRIGTDGAVTTIAGGVLAGHRDGTGPGALFHTPSGIAVDAAGTLFVADTGNHAVRRIDLDGRVTTILPAAGDGAFDTTAVGLWHPAGVAVAPFGDVYVTDAGGRVVVLAADGAARVIAGSSAGFADGDGSLARFGSLSGVAVDARGVAVVADSDNFLIRALKPPGVPAVPHDIFLTPPPLLSPAALGFDRLAWPVDPQSGWHEVTATVGEARGSVGGDGRERLHAGIDVHALPGSAVRAVRTSKVSRPISALDFGGLNEMVRIGLVAYVHVRAGRDAAGRSLDPERFTILSDELGSPAAVRIRRGTRLEVGDVVGTVNRFAHVHLGIGPRSGDVNVLRFSLDGFSDRVPPTIPPRGISLFDETGTELRPTRARFVASGRVAIVAEAWDRVDGNRRSRRLGVYRIGYQVLRRDGLPAPGFDEPRMTMEFDRLPATTDAGSIVYAEGSGIRAYGSRVTRFRYVVTNEVRDGRAAAGWWDTSRLPPGEYRVRVVAGDISGNTASRDVAVTIVPSAAAPSPISR